MCLLFRHAVGVGLIKAAYVSSVLAFAVEIRTFGIGAF
jgi:hypothetical protein